MTVNIYDDLNKLEATFRQTTEFSEVQQAVGVVKADEEALALFKNFRKIQLDLQEKQMAGEEVEAD
ncbi:YlbF family regulator, partial [Microvirga sp. 3-52]|nr:YlbF family regulator [Microvirga sp. 3-52]